MSANTTSICVRGCFDEVVAVVSQETELPQDCIRIALKTLLDNPGLLCSSETIQFGNGTKHVQNGISNLVLNNGEVFLNVKASSLVLGMVCATALAYKFCDLDPSLFLSSGIGLAILKMIKIPILLYPDERIGEKCILLEIAKNQRAAVTASIIKAQIGGKCDKDYICDFNKGGRCTCTKGDVENLMKRLESKHVLRGDTSGYSLSI